MVKFIRRHLPLIFVLFLFVLAVGGYFYKNNISYENPASATQTELQMLADEVGKLIILPTNEVPTIATVSDPSALKNQAFFADAKKGDKVLIYTNAKKAILYDPIVKKIVNVAPVNTGDIQKSNQITPNISPTGSSPKTEF